MKLKRVVDTMEVEVVIKVKGVFWFKVGLWIIGRIAKMFGLKMDLEVKPRAKEQKQ